MYEVVRGEQVDAVVVPRLLLAQCLCLRIVHVSCHHEVAFAVVAAADVRVARAALDACQFGGGEDAVTPYDVLPILSVLADCEGSPLSAVAHVAI